MKLYLKSVTVAIITLVTLGFSGCGSDKSASKETTNPSPSEKISLITQNQMNVALESADVSQDEFSGDYTINMKRKVSPFFKDLEKGSSNQGVVEVTLTSSGDSASKWDFNLMTSFVGDAWIFHNYAEIKSSLGVQSISIDPLNRRDEVMSGYGDTETAMALLKPDQATLFCYIAEGENLKARLSGTHGNVTGFVKNPSNLRSICTLWKGLVQGLHLPK